MDNDPLGRGFDQRLKLGVVPQRSRPHTEPSARKLAISDELVGYFFGEAAGNGKANTGAQAADECINPDDFAFDIDQRPPAISGINVGVRLNKLLVHQYETVVSR